MRIEPLSAHDRSQFASGQLDLDEWFHLRAGQDQRRGLARVFVAVDDAIGVIGFYSLSSSAVRLNDLPDDISRRLPRYPLVPAVLIGRLARDERVRGQGVGELLLGDAILRIVHAVESVAAFAITVEAADEPAARFYAGFGFRGLGENPLRMFLPMSTALASVTRQTSG